MVKFAELLCTESLDFKRDCNEGLLKRFYQRKLMFSHPLYYKYVKHSETKVIYMFPKIVIFYSETTQVKDVKYAILLLCGTLTHGFDTQIKMDDIIRADSYIADVNVDAITFPRIPKHMRNPFLTLIDSDISLVYKECCSILTFLEFKDMMTWADKSYDNYSSDIKVVLGIMVWKHFDHMKFWRKISILNNY